MTKKSSAEKHYKGFDAVYKKALASLKDCDTPAQLKTLCEVFEKIQKGQLTAEGVLNPLDESAEKLNEMYSMLHEYMRGETDV